MRITINILKGNPAHITFDVFVNGGNSGTLILRQDEFHQFMEILQPDEIHDDKGKIENI